jgi:hypothetical protein
MESAFERAQSRISWQLQDRSIRFNRILNGQKIPIGRDWTTRNYAYDAPELIGYLAEGHNYGICTGIGDLVVFDVDEPQLLQDVIDQLPETFTVRTGSGGSHYYLFSSGFERRIVLHHPSSLGGDGKRLHLGNPKFVALGERLEKVKERHEQGFLTSLEFLKEILEIAKEVVEAEKETDPKEERDLAKEALTELFSEAKSKNTHIIVERIVTDIDDIVKKVRFPDWQHTSQGERLVQKELRKALLKYKLHTDQDLFDRAYAYIRQYY